MDDVLKNQAKARKNILYLTIGIIVFVLVVNVGIGGFLTRNKTTSGKQEAIPSQGIEKTSTDTFSYKGEDGIDALVLLQKHAKTSQNSSGLVIGINGRKADDTKHEFWEFLVNGKEASVGPKDYITKDNDVIEWKIAHY